jgi:hypothetical protein
MSGRSFRIARPAFGNRNHPPANIAAIDSAAVPALGNAFVHSATKPALTSTPEMMRLIDSARLPA